MVVGIHEDRLGKFPVNLKVFEEILEHNGIDHIRLNVNDIDFWEKVAGLDLFVFRWNVATDLKQLAKTIMPVIEQHMGVKVFPDLATSWHYDDKIAEYYLLKENGFPVINFQTFWNRARALEWTRHARFPTVFKLRSGSKSDNIILVKSARSARKLINKMFGSGIDPNRVSFNIDIRLRNLTINRVVHNLGLHVYRSFKGEDRTPYWEKHKNYVLFQDFQTDNPYDTRVTVIGNRAFAFKRYNRRGDFRASGSGMLDYNPEELDKECLKIAFRISKKLRFQSMAYDFIYNKDQEPVICEISYIYVEKALYEAPGYWDEQLEWHPGHFSPQYFILMDALGRPDLKQPDLSHLYQA